MAGRCNDGTASATMMRQQLRSDAYVDVVAERCVWEGGLDALRVEGMLLASDGAYDHVGTGAWGLVVCRPGGFELMSGVVSAGCGTNSPYRSEAYGVLAGMRYVYDSGLEGDFDHILDNEAVVKVYQDCEARGPSLVCSQDVWDEIIWYKRCLHGRYRVRWRRGHAIDRVKSGTRRTVRIILPMA